MLHYPVRHQSDDEGTFGFPAEHGVRRCHHRGGILRRHGSEPPSPSRRVGLFQHETESFGADLPPVFLFLVSALYSADADSFKNFTEKPNT